MTRLFAATGNAGKLREFRMAAERYPEIEIDLLPGFREIEPCIETGLTFEENAILKARHYGRYTPGLLFADDSGLEVDALGGAPGVFSARFAGVNATDAANNRLLLETLACVQPRTARFVCAIALVEADRVLGVFHGAVEGLITDAPRGPQGFGYDPLFFFPAFGCTFGETSAERKLLVSHRGQALRSLFAAVQKTGQTLFS